MKDIYIFGAHSRAQTLATYIRYLEPDWNIKGFLVNNDEPNEKVLKGIPVIHMGHEYLNELVLECPVYIATRGIYHEQIITALRINGFHSFVTITPEYDRDIRNRFLEKYYYQQGKSFVRINDDIQTKCNIDQLSNTQFSIYVAKISKDKLMGDQYSLPDYAKYIMVGAELENKDKLQKLITDDVESIVFDNTGDNISAKNRSFCELTGLYWIWKNAKEEYVGLEHYRRHFLLPDDWKERMIANDVDVILPIPLWVEPSVADNYKMRHVADDWDFVMDYLKENHPEDYAFAKEYFKSGLYSPCNMFIMKKQILDEFCEWLFPILFAIEEKVGRREDSYQNRYPGFLSERLMTMYFAKNEERIKRIYADKNFLT